jgi:hypothetical protein
MTKAKFTLLLLFIFFFSNSKGNIVIPTDAGITTILSPSITGCYSSSVPVVVTIQNFGTNNLSSIPVNVYVTGAIPQTITATFSGNLSAGASTNFVVGNVDMSLGGTYNFTAVTNVVGDGNTNNDPFSATRTVTPMIVVSGPAIACAGNTITLNASGGNTYTWSNGANGNTVSVSPTVTTTYSVAGTNTAGCTAVNYYTVNIQTPTISTQGGFACISPSNGTLTASSFTPSIISWYATPSSTTVLGTGNNFPISATTSVIYYAEALSVAPSTLFTTMAGGNSSQGNMFDLIAINSVTIDGLELHFNGVGIATVQVWYRAGTFVGFETSNTGWTQALTATVNALGSGILTPVNATFAVPCPGSQITGIYITSNGGPGLNYTNGTVLGNLYTSDQNLNFYEGKGGTYFNVTSSPRIFNGKLKYYRAGCTSPRTPATFSIVPGFSISAFATNSAVCSGSNITINASGATTYTWLPNENIGPSQFSGTIVASPTAATIYTVTGSVPSCTMQPSFTINIGVVPGPTLTITPPFASLSGAIVGLSGSGAFTYSWQPGGSNNNNIIVQPLVTTVYTLTGTNQFGCSSTITTTIFISAIGMKENKVEGGEIILYPNPTEGILNVECEILNEGVRFQLFNSIGEMVAEEKILIKQSTLNIQDLSSGIYFFQLTDTSNDTVLKRGKLILR